MSRKRKIEVFSAGCALCTDTLDLVHRIACSSCDISVHDMHDPQVAQRAHSLGIHRVPAVLIDGKLADCCALGAVDEQSLRAAGVGTPI